MRLPWFIICLVFTVWCAEGSDVLELGDSDFDRSVALHETLLVEFFAPWYVLSQAVHNICYNSTKVTL